MGLRQSVGLDGFERALCLLPTHFGHGLICNCLYPWLSGHDLYILPPFRPDLISDLGRVIDEHGITFMSSVPSVWRLALRIARPPRQGTLRRVFIGSAPLTAALWSGVQEWTGTAGVLNAYGITETGSWLAGTTVPEFTPEDGLVGVPWGGIIRVLRSADPGVVLDPANECARGESGHVWVQTPALMRGYLDRDDLTEQVVSAGWFVTGDIGAIDDRGWLYLRGREREEINKGGMKVHPSDVDAVVERRNARVASYAERSWGKTWVSPWFSTSPGPTICGGSWSGPGSTWRSTNCPGAGTCSMKSRAPPEARSTGRRWPNGARHSPQRSSERVPS
jgi:acyl-CoA synthetase (AMP-forming)/AMP-acid ligase II